jgi:cyclophilin family peptidyl-prolyl cis-trans isomerase
MRRRNGMKQVCASVTRRISVAVLTLALVGCSPSPPEATVEEPITADASERAPTGMTEGTPVTADASPEPATEESSGPPILVIETAKGTIEIETFPEEAPNSVEHIVALINRRFYNGLRIHRVEPGFVVQFGDPQTRDMTRRATWGTGGSGDPIGVSEVSPAHRHRLGSVALAHPGDPTRADSQMYISFGPQPALDAEFTVFGQVTSGMDVARALAVNDVIKSVTVRQ